MAQGFLYKAIFSDSQCYNMCLYPSFDERVLNPFHFFPLKKKNPFYLYLKNSSPFIWFSMHQVQ